MGLQAKLLILAVLLNVALVVVTGVRLILARFAARKAGEVNRKRIALDSSAWPDNVRKLGNNYSNQFEFPVVFYALVPLLLITALADWVQVALSFVFVVSRAAHSAIHTGSNVVMTRLKVFLVGVITVVAMWLWFALRLYVIG